MGKSTIKELYLAALEGDRLRKDHTPLRKERIHPITFNAWRYGGDNIKRALLRHAFLELGGDESRLADALFHQVTRSAQEARPWKEILKDLYGRFGFGLALILLFLALIVGLAWLLIDVLLGLRDMWAAVGLTVLIGAGAWLARPLASLQWLLVARYAPFTRVELPQASAEQYESLLIEQVRRFKHRDGQACERLVIFVDDLDRLSAEEMVAGLDAIRTFMELSDEGSPNGPGVVFVVSCDEERVAKALSERGRSSDLPGAVFSRQDARRFLDRIFQFRLEIPPLPKQDLRGFALEKLQHQMPDLALDLVQRGASLQEVVDRLIHVGVQSPRNVVQILNAFAETWWLARRREHTGAGRTAAADSRTGP